MSWVVLVNLTCQLTSGAEPLVLIEEHEKKSAQESVLRFHPSQF